jgi:hypothetical protein
LWIGLNVNGHSGLTSPERPEGERGSTPGPYLACALNDQLFRENEFLQIPIRLVLR